MRLTDKKQDFFISKIQEILSIKGKKVKILDIGSCTGNLTNSIKKRYGELIDIEGIDLSEKMVKMACDKYPHINFHVGSSYELPFSKSVFDIVILSSVLHEFGSYYDKDYTEYSYDEGIQKGLESIKNVLSSAGHVLIKDPVKPLNGDKKVKIVYQDNAFSSDKIAGIHGMNYLERTKYFIKLFPWFDSRIFDVGKDYICMTLQDLNEVSRHTSHAICNTQEHFDDELKEWYGSWNHDSWMQYINRTGNFQLRNHNTFFSYSNHSVDFITTSIY